ncbi:MAG: cupin domain-containing protein [Herbaspirillum sp.]
MSPLKLTDVLTNTGTDRPALDYWHLWVDAAGISHQRRCTLTAFEQQSMGGAAPQWNDKLEQRPASVLFSILPVGWIGEWHENPKPQWIVPLSGCWFVESMDGMRMEFGVGNLSFGGDQGCTSDAQGRTGHRSGTHGDQPAVLMIVQLEQQPNGLGSCCFS